MYCPRQITYTIRQGDTIYMLAKQFNTTAQHIMAINPGINPHNLRIGSRIIICPGTNVETTPQPPSPPGEIDTDRKVALYNAMRLVWLQQVYWTRLLILSIIDKLGDENVTIERLMENPGEVARVFAAYYPPGTAQTIARQLNEHLATAAALIFAMGEGDEQKVRALRRRWYMNADNMATTFSALSPQYDQEEIREKFFRQLDITTDEVSARLARDYPTDLMAFEEAEGEILRMADIFADGITKQFPQKF